MKLERSSTTSFLSHSPTSSQNAFPMSRACNVQPPSCKAVQIPYKIPSLKGSVSSKLFPSCLEFLYKICRVSERLQYMRDRQYLSIVLPLRSSGLQQQCHGIKAVLCNEACIVGSAPAAHLVRLLCLAGKTLQLLAINSYNIDHDPHHSVVQQPMNQYVSKQAVIAKATVTTSSVDLLPLLTIQRAMLTYR